MNEDLQRAVEALRAGAQDVLGMRDTSSRSELRARLRRTVEEILDHLEAEQNEPEDVFTGLERQSQDIAEDLRRADRLMKERGGAPHRD